METTDKPRDDAASERPPEVSRTPPFWIVRRMQPGLMVSLRGHFFRHATRALAEAEAQRLATLAPGTRFVVLQAVASFIVNPDGTECVRVDLQ